MVGKAASRKKLDILVLLGLFGLGILFAYLTRISYFGKPLFVGAVFTAVPALYLSFRKRKNWGKIALAVFLFGLVFAFVLDFVAELTLTWSTVSRVFGAKIFGVSPVDNLLGYMMMTFATTVFYEHFVDDEKDRRISSNLFFAVLPGLLAVGFLLGAYALRPSLLDIRYPYLGMGLAAIVPPILLAVRKPNMIKKMVITASYFFVIYFTIELFAVSYGWWVYQGNNYIGWVTIFGRAFPFEEFFFWMMFYAASLVSYYEIFIDDLR